MSKDAGLDQIIAALQEYSVSQPGNSTAPVDPSLDVARFFKSMTDKIEQISVPVAAEPVVEVVEKAATKPKKVPAPAVAGEEDEEDDDDELTDEERMAALRARGKKATRKSMNEEEVQTVIQNAVAPINESIAKLTELVTVMANAQMQTAKSEEAPVAAAPVVEAPVAVAPVEKSEEVAPAPVLDTDALIARIVEGLAAKLAPAQETAAVVENAEPVAKAEEALIPTASHSHLPAYVNAPGYTANAHTPVALENVGESPTVQAANVMKSMGFQPSVPVVRTPLGVEANAGETAPETDEVTEIMKSVDELASLPFGAINKLRDSVGAWK